MQPGLHALLAIVGATVMGPDPTPRTIAVQMTPVTHVAFSHAGARLVFATESNTLRGWDVERGALLYEVGIESELTDLAVRPDSEMVAFTARALQGVGRLDGETGFLGQEAALDPVEVTCAAWDKEGRYVWAGTAAGNVQRLAFRGAGESASFAIGAGRITAIAVGPGGRRAAVGDRGGGLRTVRLENGKLDRELEGHVKEVTDIAFHHKDSLFATASADGTVRVWSTSRSKPRLVIEGSSEGLRSVAFDPTGARLAGGAADGQVLLWDAKKGTPIATLKPPEPGPATSLAFSPDGQTLAVAGTGYGVVLWDLGQGR